MPLSLLAALGLIGIYLMLRGRSRTMISDGAADRDATTLTELAKAGSDLRRSHEMEFFLYVPDRGAADAVAAQLEAEGFAVEVKAAEEGDDWLCLATRTMVPTLDELRRLRRHLAAVAESREGAYDGWGATVVGPPDGR
jgi:regulator of RNase E activity RraB